MNTAPSVSFEIEATCIIPIFFHSGLAKVVAAAVPAAALAPEMTSVE